MFLDYVKVTGSDFETTLNLLKEKLAERKFGILASISLSDKFEEKGIEFSGKLTILEICNPFEAAQALSINSNAVYFLPCKMIVRETNELTTIELARPSGLIDVLEDPKLIQFAQRIEALLIESAEAV